MKRRALVAVVAFVFVAPACGGGADEEAQTTTPAAETTTVGATTSFSDTRDAILAAVESEDYDALRPLIGPDVFLSDFGFGEEQDPVGRWEEMGSKPLETMGVLLEMPHVVRETSEGTLYEWPAYDPDSEPADLRPQDRKRFESVLSEDEVDELITGDYGYTGPRLGILADGTWWFFILEGGP
jgi:hypothetical protein